MNADSVKARLKKFAVASGCTFQEALVYQMRWDAFLKKKKALIPISLSDAIARIKIFVQPLLNGFDYSYNEWDRLNGRWK